MTVRILMKAVSPITQGEGTKGNEQIIRREAVVTPLGVRHVPTITGNSLRHRIFRDTLANDLVDRWGLAGELTKEQVRFLYNGGALGKDHGCSLERIAECEQVLPMVSLLGVSLPDTIVPGRLKCGMAWLVCRETVPQIKSDVPADWWPARDNLTPCEQFVGRGTYYRHDKARLRGELLSEKERNEEFQYTGMPHAGEHVIGGSEWYLRLDIERPNPLVVGAFAYGLTLWQQSGATVGGQSSRGHGRMAPSIDWGRIDAESAIAEYLSHVDDVAQEGRGFVLNLYTKAKA